MRMMGSVLIDMRRGDGGEGGGEGWNPANRAVLEKFGVNNDSPRKITWDGRLVGEASRETSLAVMLTPEVIDQGYLELPLDCDTSEGQPVVVIYGNINPVQGKDWRLELHDWPDKDRIVWEGLPLSASLLPGTEITVTYYKKI